MRVLLHPGHRHVLENWRLGSPVHYVECERQLTNGPQVPNLNTRGTTDWAPVPAAISPQMRVTRPNTARSAATSRSASRPAAQAPRPTWRPAPARASAPTARSSSSLASRSVCRSRSMTSTPLRRRRSSAVQSIRRATPATAARW